MTLTANAILTVSNSGMFGDADVTVDSAGTLNVGTASSTAVVIGKTGTLVTTPGNVAINGTLALGSASTTGQLLFHIASSSFTTLLQASSSQASNLTFTLPTTAGTAGQAMLTDGAGNLFFGNTGSSQWLNGTSGTISYSSGSIGINTTTPLSLLSIVGSASSTAPLFDIASSSGTSLFRVNPNGTVTVGTTVLPFPSGTLAARPATCSTGATYICTGSDCTVPGERLYCVNIYPAQIYINPSGTVFNDAVFGGTFSGLTTDTYTVAIDGTSSPNTFKWQKNAGSFTSGVAITGAAQTLTDGVTVTFGATTGHASDDSWVASTKVWSLENGTNLTNQNYFLGASAGISAHLNSDFNTGIGTWALKNLTTGYRNTGMGWSAMLLTTTGHSNTCLGYYCLGANTTGYFNAGFGYKSLYFNTTGFYNTSMGLDALALNTSGSENTGIGVYSLYTGTTGSQNVGVGNYSLNLHTGTGGTAVGWSALRHNTADYNVGVGYGAGVAITSGNQNVVVGDLALETNTTHASNTAIGHKALDHSDSDQNTAVGATTAYNISSGHDNTVLGYYGVPSLTTGGYMTAVGSQTVSAADADHVSLFGFGATQTGAGVAYATCMGAGCTTALASSVTLGRALDVARSVPTTFSNLPSCATGTEGAFKAVTDSDVNTWGTTVVHTSGAYHVLAYCDGTNWTVAAK